MLNMDIEASYTESWTGLGTVDWSKLTGSPGIETPWLVECLKKACRFQGGAYRISASNWLQAFADAAAYSVADYPGFDARIRRWIEQNQRNLPEAEDTRAELVVGRVLADSVAGLKSLPESNAKTFDMLASFAGGVEVEVEVCSPRRKPSWALGAEASMELARKMSALGVEGVVIGILEDEPTQTVAQEILAATWGVGLGMRAERQGLWFVHDSVEEGEPSTPDWWPHQYATPVIKSFSVEIDFGCKSVMRRLPIQIVRGLSAKAYVNAVQAKAGNGQLTGTRPGVVAVHATNLPGWTKWAAQELDEYFGGWPSVSGILAVTSATSFHSLHDDIALFLNAHATNPLPPAVATALQTRSTARPYWR